ncbi:MULTISPECIES: peptidoglycan-binding protein [unclassified Bradyrhizobium]|uniref:peptidoglycan-binding protein n=1 Tax=unclassified Bradyrhizobium TaxID=2631580 RepID=UPI0028E3E726|nr:MULTISPECIES: peptidoglycan-binding protein [unclassified Bradyrhizobium]
MRRLATATFICAIAACASAQAQTPQGALPGAKPKPVATQPVRPGVQAPADTANAMSQAERLALQSDLAWVGQYNGAITGDVSERMVNAIKEYQKLAGGKPTGVLNPQERAVLADTARRKQEGVGWKLVTEPVSGARLGIPTKLVPQQTSDGTGSKWTSPTGTVQVALSRRKEANPVTATLADREKKEPGRTVDYSVVKPDFFVLSGLQNLKKFYIRGTFRGDEVRILTILYDQATENTVEPVVIAMSSAFTAFPSTLAAQPAPRRSVDYGTGIIASQDGAIIADREVTDSCVAITVPGFGHAERVAEDKERGLALLRIYGARGLKPLALSGGRAKSSVDIVGIADPQSQGGGAAISTVKAQLAANGAGDASLAPAPGLGFSGAAALDGDGKFAGVTLLKSGIMAGTALIPSTQVVMVSADATRAFLTAQGVKPDGTSLDAKAATVRVICVRK